LPVNNTLAAGNLGYDNEFIWGTALLGHSEDDYQRPVVFHPNVTVPAAPSSLAGTGGALTWADATPAATSLGNPANEVGFQVLKAPITGNTVGAYATIATLPANTTTYTDPAASGASSYEVVAFNNAGSATSTPQVQIAALAAPTWAATTPVVVNTNGTIKLTWNKVAGSSNYLISSGGVLVATVVAATGTGTQNTTITLPWGVNYTAITIQSQLVFTGVTPSITVNSVASAAVSASLLAFPATPAAPTATNVAATSLTLNWATVSGAASYNVQRATNVNFNGATTTTGVTSPLAVTGLTANTTYYFRVVGVNGANTANGAASAAVTTLAATPGVPTVTTSGITSTGYSLNFATTGASGYTVLLNGTAVSTNQAASTYVVTGAASGTSFGPYTVQACSNTGTTCSAASTAVNVLTLPAAPAAPTTASVAATTLTLNWTAVTGAASYTVQRAGNASFTGTVTNIATGVTALTQAVTGLTAGSTYYFRVVAVNASGSSNGTVTGAVTTLAATPGVPTGLASSALTSTGYTLGWGTVNGATGYNVLLNGVAVSTNQAGTSYVVTGAANTTIGTYTVQACSNVGTTCSTASAGFSKLTLPATQAAPAVGTVGAPTKTATLTWNAPAGTGTISNYTLQASVNGGAFAALPGGVTTAITGATAANAAGTGATISGLTVGRTYSFKLIVTNASGSSTASAGSTTFTAK
jgi:hypothetical protein